MENSFPKEGVRAKYAVIGHEVRLLVIETGMEQLTDVVEPHEVDQVVSAGEVVIKPYGFAITRLGDSILKVKGDELDGPRLAQVLKVPCIVRTLEETHIAS